MHGYLLIEVSSTKPTQKQAFLSANALKIEALSCLLRFRHSSKHRVGNGNTDTTLFACFPYVLFCAYLGARPPTLLHPALVKGRIITEDALHTQKKFCAIVHVYGGYYLLIVKGNQPQMQADLLDFFEDKDMDQGEWEYYKRCKRGMGC